MVENITFEEESSKSIDTIETRINERYPSIKKLILTKLKSGQLWCPDIGTAKLDHTCPGLNLD